jgi:hypothetical protein
MVWVMVPYAEDKKMKHGLLSSVAEWQWKKQIGKH